MRVPVDWSQLVEGLIGTTPGQTGTNRYFLITSNIKRKYWYYSFFQKERYGIVQKCLAEVSEYIFNSKV
jgi:hypothetical protein